MIKKVLLLMLVLAIMQVGQANAFLGTLIKFGWKVRNSVLTRLTWLYKGIILAEWISDDDELENVWEN